MKGYCRIKRREMDGDAPQGVRWSLVGDVRSSDAGSGRHRDDGRVPPKVTFVRFGWIVGNMNLDRARSSTGADHTQVPCRTNPQRSIDNSHVSRLLVTQADDRIEGGGSIGRIVPEEEADSDRDRDSHNDPEDG